MSDPLAWCDRIDLREASQRPKRTLAAVHIPASEIENRPFELPSKDEPLRIVEGAPEDAQRFLAHRGHPLSYVACESIETNSTQRFRLWSPGEWLEETMAESLPGKALCLGCGAGREAVWLADRGWSVVAVDRLPDALDIGRRLAGGYLRKEDGNIEWVKSEAAEFLSSSSAQFDLVVCQMFYEKSLPALLEKVVSPQGFWVVEDYWKDFQFGGEAPASTQGPMVFPTASFKGWNIARAAKKESKKGTVGRFLLQTFGAEPNSPFLVQPSSQKV